MSKIMGILRLIRPANCFMMGFAVFVGIILAHSVFSNVLLLKIIFGFCTGFFLTGAAMIINDYFDRKIDAINEPSRPIPAGLVSPNEALFLFSSVSLVGFIFAYHDISAGIQKAKGRIWPYGWYHILKERNRNDWVNINGVGMLPNFQGLGGNAILYTEIDKSVKSFGFKHIDIVQVNETNFSSYHDMEAIGVQWYKRHRSYKREL